MSFAGRRWATALTIVAAGLGFSQAQAVELIKKDNVSINLGGRMQLLGIGQHVDDPTRDDYRMYLFMNQARLITDGTIGDYRFYAEWAMGGEEAVKNLNSSVGLIDYRVDIPLAEHFYARVGQFKVPWGREALVNDGSMMFTTRSINHLGSLLGRDVGVAAVLQQEGFMGTFGVFTGGGRDTPERYLPEQLGIPLLAARIGYDSTGTDPYNYMNSGSFAKDQSAFSAFVNLMYSRDTVIGHSTALNVRPTDKNLLLNPVWNPYIGQSPMVRSEYWGVSLDSQVRFPVGEMAAMVEAEVTSTGFSNTYGTIHLPGARVTGSVAKDNVEVAMRYAVLQPSDAFKYKGNTITGTELIHEVTPSVTYYHRPWSRFIFEAPMNIDTPVVEETGIGSYVLVQQPDQTTYLDGKGSVSRKFVPEARLMYQLSF
jgi:hypothetical protein